MSIYTFSAFLNGLSAIIFGLVVFLKNPKQLVNKLFGFMTLSLAVWSFSYSFWQLSHNYQVAFFWVRILSIGSLFIPIFFVHWIFVLFKLDKKKKNVLVFGYLMTLFFLCFSFSSLFIKEIKPQLQFAWWPQAGIIYTLFIFCSYGGLVGYSSYLLIKLHKRADKLVQDQIKYVLLAVVVGFGGGAFNFPLWYGLPIPPYGNFLVFLYPFILAYTVLKYRLMDIKIVLTQFLVGILSFLLLIQLLTSKTTLEYLWRGVFLLTFFYFGYLLVRSVNQEIERRAELQRLYQEVERLSKNKSEFISIASHQLRTPLVAIKGYISMILEESYGKIDQRMVRPMTSIYQSNERLIRLVNDLLNLSRLDAGRVKFEPTLTSLEELVKEIVEELEITAKDKKLYLKIKKPKEPLPEIMVDRDHIGQVIFNILDNAIKYTQKGGITIEMKKIDNKEQIKISDTGEGMTKREISSLFQMFTRATAGAQFHIEGAGLGLYVVRKFVEMHKGRIYAESKGKGKGSIFYIELPIKSKRAVNLNNIFNK